MKKKQSQAPRPPSPVVKKIERLEDLTLDPRNPNRHTKRGRDLVEQSLRQLGAGRAPVAAADGTVLAGNLTVEEAVAAGFKAKVVQTYGDELVIVQRMDLHPDSPEAKKLRVVDNQASAVSLDWDLDVIAEMRREAPELLADSFTPFELDAMVGGGAFEFTGEAQKTMVEQAAAAQSRPSPEQVAALREAKKKSMAAAKDRDDSEFTLHVVFPNREEREAFCERWGQDREAKYVSGVEFNDALKARVPPAEKARR